MKYDLGNKSLKCEWNFIDVKLKVFNIYLYKNMVWSCNIWVVIVGIFLDIVYEILLELYIVFKCVIIFVNFFIFYIIN